MTLALYGRWAMILLAWVTLASSLKAQTAQNQSCDVMRRFEGEWNWIAGSKSDDSPRGTFVFSKAAKDTPAELRITWFFPQSKNSRSDFFVISGDPNVKHGATYTDDKGRESACSVRIANNKCVLTLSCRSAIPPQYMFFPGTRDHMRFSFDAPPPHHHAEFVPWMVGEANKIPKASH